jgi:hypothetical protein
MYSKTKVLVILLVLLALTLACGQPINNQELPIKELPTLATNTPQPTTNIGDMILQSGAGLAGLKPTPTQWTCTVKGALNLRDGVGVDGTRILAVLHDGVTVVIVDEIEHDGGVWYQVQTVKDGFINSGWCE